MDPILVLIIIEQSIATVVIAAAIVIYSRATTRILEAHVEPEVHVTVEGELVSNTLTITNHAGCTVSNLNVIISVGCIWGSQPYPSRHCLYFGAWEMIAAGATEKSVEQPITPKAFASAQLPDGAKVNTHDIFVEYSFTRRADQRRYSFKYQLGVLEQADGRLMYVRMEQPKMLSQAKSAYEETCIPAAVGSDPMWPANAGSLPGTGANSPAAAHCIG